MDFNLPNLNTIIAGLFSIIILSYFIQKMFGASKSRKPPEAAGRWPLIGHLHLLGGKSQLPHIVLGSLADKYGSVFSIRIGVHSALVISSWELAKECFTTNDVVLASRPKLAAAKNLGYDSVMMGFSPYGSYWREMRKIISLELLSTRRLELLKDVRASEMETSLKELYKVWTEKKDGSDGGGGGVSVEMKQWFGDLALNVVLRMVAGKRYVGAAATADKEGRRCQKAFREFFHLMGQFLVGDAIPYLGWTCEGHEENSKGDGLYGYRVVGGAPEEQGFR